MKGILVAAAALLASNVALAKSPNVVVILADDLGWGDARVYNPASLIPTPNIDRLASDGMRFSDAHTPSSVCTPTRYGLLTGRYAWRTHLKKGVLYGESPALIEPGRSTIASMLKGRGYATAVIGKWHLGLGTAEKTDFGKPLTPGPTTVGFDEFFGIPASLDMPPYLFVQNTGVVEPATGTIADSKNQTDGGAGFWRGGPIAPSFKHAAVLSKLTDRAVSYVERQAKARKPFFLYWPLTAPHLPWQPTSAFDGKSKAGPYGDFVVQTDAAIGEFLDALERLKVAQDTLVILTSDNGARWYPADIERYGGHRANGPWRGQKADIWDAGHRVPFLVRWPGRVKAGTVSDQTICLTDVMATLAHVTGAKLSGAEDSIDFLPVLESRAKKPVRESIVHHAADGMFAIRAGTWKLALGLGSGGFSAPKRVDPKTGEPPGQLYDLAKDPAETTNVYAQHPDVVARLTGMLDVIRAR